MFYPLNTPVMDKQQENPSWLWPLKISSKVKGLLSDI